MDKAAKSFATEGVEIDPVAVTRGKQHSGLAALLPKPSEQLIAVHSGHLQIRDNKDYLVFPLTVQLESFLPIGSTVDRVEPEHMQIPPHVVPARRVVIGYQDRSVVAATKERFDVLFHPSLLSRWCYCQRLLTEPGGPHMLMS